MRIEKRKKNQMAKFLCVITSVDYHVHYEGVCVVSAANAEEAEIKARKQNELYESDDIQAIPFSELKVGFSDMLIER